MVHAGTKFSEAVVSTQSTGTDEILIPTRCNMANPKCKLCDKTVYPVEAIKALDATWHLKCLKCGVCNTRLSLTTLHSYDKMPYCRSHVPTVKHTTVADDVSTQHAKDAQAKASYANKNNVETHKGTAGTSAFNIS
eukprot:TRINITY_DN3494_c0_g1_i1.p1 TRINITY_DN3494_c0_g1~~TRINITY_DN3494_c0_g1_i1.p1  ORF type:complete len:136 (+),score=17.46 TRINITY_DN3494_c0_g1_i1:18-425(+)